QNAQARKRRRKCRRCRGTRTSGRCPLANATGWNGNSKRVFKNTAGSCRRAKCVVCPGSCDHSDPLWKNSRSLFCEHILLPAGILEFENAVSVAFLLLGKVDDAIR